MHATTQSMYKLFFSQIFKFSDYPYTFYFFSLVLREFVLKLAKFNHR